MERGDKLRFVADRPDFADLELGLDALVAPYLAEVVLEMIADDSYVSFPAIWGKYGDGLRGPPVDDPTMLYIRLSIPAKQEEHVTFSVSLREALQHELGDLDEPELLPLRDAFRSLADMIDDALSSRDSHDQAPKPEKQP